MPSARPWRTDCVRPTPSFSAAARSCSQRKGRDRLPDSPLFGLRPPDGAHRHKALQRGRSPRGLAQALFKAEEDPGRLRRGARRRTLARDASPEPREFGKPTSLWTLALAAEASFEEGITERRVSAETVSATLERMGVRWLRAKRWITSPGPEYARKKGAATG